MENCLSGFNSSIFAYGQTGSGKTYTMIGNLPCDRSSSLPADVGVCRVGFSCRLQLLPCLHASRPSDT